MNFFRKSLREEYCIKGEKLGKWPVINHLSSFPFSFAAIFAASTTVFGRPSKSFLSNQSSNSLVAFKVFFENCGESVERSLSISRNLALSVSFKAAPFLTKSL